MTDEAFYPEITDATSLQAVAKTSPELADELYLAPRANLKGRATSEEAAALVAFLHDAHPRPTEAGERGAYSPGAAQIAKRRQAIAALLAELLIAAVVEDGLGWLMMSLRKGDYNHPSPVSWRTFDGIRQPWKDAGLLEENTGYPPVLAFGNPGPTVGRLTRFRATPKMVKICKRHGITVENAEEHFAVKFDMPSELVKITRPSVATPNTPRVRHLRDEVAALNAFFAKHKLVGARHIGWVRMFHEATGPDFPFDKGGRLYSQPGVPKLNYQHMPRDLRTAMTIDGELLAEIDISGCYLTIFYAAHGKRVDVAGAYDDILGSDAIDRAVVKAWVNASFGNRGLLRQWSADIKKTFAKKHRTQGWEIDPKKYPVAQVRKLTLARHPLLASWGEYAPGIPSSWADLMYRESQVIISTMIRLATEHAIPSLPVYDSILVQRSNVPVARRLLEEQFMALVGVTPLLNVYLAVA